MKFEVLATSLIVKIASREAGSDLLTNMIAMGLFIISRILETGFVSSSTMFKL